MEAEKLIRRKTHLLAAVVLALAGTTQYAAPAAAGEDFESVVSNIRACGKWVFKLHDFGKNKIRNYTDYVPPNLQSNFPAGFPTKSNGLFEFDPTDNTFVITFFYPDQQGNITLATVGSLIPRVLGTYKQNGKKLKLQMNGTGSPNPGVDVMAEIFRNLVANHLFGDRQLTSDLPFATIRESKVRFKGRVKDANKIDIAGNSRAQLRMKMKSRLIYDIRFMTNSDEPDQFGVAGVFKMRFRTKDCSD